MSSKRALRPSSWKTWRHSSEQLQWFQNTPFIAYVAGLIDGEGCLSLMERTNEECSRRSFSFRLSVEMSNKARELLLLCQSRLGGNIHSRTKRSATHQDQTSWSMSTREALPLLEALLPHMIVKREQCRLCISACRLILEKPKGFEENLSILKQLMHELNKTGPQTKLRSGWVARIVDGAWLSRQGDLLEATGLARFSGPWPRAGYMQNGAVYPLPELVSPIGGTGSGLLPTLGKNEPKGSSRERYKGSAEYHGAKMSEGLRSGPDDPIYLHPDFAEQVMGYPDGWTVLAPSETP